ncbi:MAG TPA: thioredoxin-dependent thiol peroxidase [Gemmatimonadaceae bacterium]
MSPAVKRGGARAGLPKVGQLAPDFTLPADDGTEVQLKALRGQPVVLYFYPKDNTPGCTAEACDFRDLFPRFRKGKAVVLGVSPDSVRKHQNFRKKFDLPFTLLADTDHAVAERYGVWGEKTFWGRKYMGVLRTTFLIDAAGEDRAGLGGCVRRGTCRRGRQGAAVILSGSLSFRASARNLLPGGSGKLGATWSPRHPSCSTRVLSPAPFSFPTGSAPWPTT